MFHLPTSLIPSRSTTAFPLRLFGLLDRNFQTPARKYDKFTSKHLNPAPEDAVLFFRPRATPDRLLDLTGPVAKYGAFSAPETFTSHGASHLDSADLSSCP